MCKVNQMKRCYLDKKLYLDIWTRIIIYKELTNALIMLQMLFVLICYLIQQVILYLELTLITLFREKGKISTMMSLLKYSMLNNDLD